MSKPILVESEEAIKCPTCGATETVSLAIEMSNYPMQIFGEAITWCVNGHVCVRDHNSGLEVYNFKGGI